MALGAARLKDRADIVGVIDLTRRFGAERALRGAEERDQHPTCAPNSNGSNPHSIVPVFAAEQRALFVRRQDTKVERYCLSSLSFGLTADRNWTKRLRVSNQK